MTIISFSMRSAMSGCQNLWGGFDARSWRLGLLETWTYERREVDRRVCGTGEICVRGPIRVVEG